MYSRWSKIELQGTDEDEIFKGLNNYFRKLAERQIRIAFEQAEKEVHDLHQRTKEGIETARLNGKQIGQKKAPMHIYIDALQDYFYAQSQKSRLSNSYNTIMMLAYQIAIIPGLCSYNLVADQQQHI